VERNALRAGLAPRPEDWRWGSLRRKLAAAADCGPGLAAWPIDRPADRVKRVNAPLNPAEEEAMLRSIRRGQPLGTPDWQTQTAARLGLGSTLRPLGRPKEAISAPFGSCHLFPLSRGCPGGNCPVRRASGCVTVRVQ
jgi:hypothetical protein